MNNAKEFIKNRFHTVGERSDGTVLCLACMLPLTDPVSQAAGMGKICSAKIRFAEKLTRNQLFDVEGTPETINLDAQPMRTVIARIKGEVEPRLITYIRTNGEEDQAFFNDRLEFDKYYEKGESYADAFLKSIYCIDVAQVDSIAPVKGIDNENFKAFQENYREEVKARETDYQDKVLISSVKHLDRRQKEERATLVKSLNSGENSSRAREKWGSGEVALSTLFVRLEQSKITGAVEFLSALKEQYPKTRIRDHGLTDEQIRQGLLQAKMVPELKIYVSLVKGKAQVFEMIKLYNEIKKNPSAELYREFNKLTH